MKRYLVEFIEHYELEVEAMDKEEAQQKAYENYANKKESANGNNDEVNVIELI